MSLFISNEGDGVIECIHGVESVDFLSQLPQLRLPQLHAHPFGLVPYSDTLIQTHIPKFDNVATAETEPVVVFAHQFILTLLSVFPFYLAVLVDHIVQGVQAH